MTLNNLPIRDYSVNAEHLTAVFTGAGEAAIRALDPTELAVRTDTGDAVTTYTGYTKLYSITTYADSDDIRVQFAAVSDLERKVAELEAALRKLLET